MKRSGLCFIALILLTSLACRFTAYLKEPPQVQFIIPNENQHLFFTNELIDITFYAQGEVNIPYVTANLGDPNGQLLGAFGDPNGQGENTLRGSIPWTPTAPGRYIIYLTAYDEVGRPSEPARMAVQIYNRPVIVMHGSKTLEHSNSFDFVSGEVEGFTGGDLYLVRNGPGDFTFLANNPPQIGGASVDVNYISADIQQILFEMDVVRELYAPNRDRTITMFDVPVRQGGLYRYKRNAPPGDYVLFRVTNVTDDKVTLDYVVVSLP